MTKTRRDVSDGRDLVVAPVTSPGTTAETEVWVPPGAWVERTTGQRLRGPGQITMTVPLDRIPVLVRAGVVLPAHVPGVGAGTAPQERMVLTAYPGRAGRGALYDDAGAGFSYESGRFTRTTFAQRRRGDAVVVTVGPARGHFRGDVLGICSCATSTVRGRSSSTEDVSLAGPTTPTPAPRAWC